MRINVKLLIAFLFISLTPLIIIGVLSYSTTQEALTQQVLTNLENIASIQKSRIENILNQKLERLALVSSNTKLCESLSNYIRRKNTTDQEWMYKILRDTRDSVASFKNISILGRNGVVLISTDMDKFGISYRDEDFFIKGYRGNVADMFFLDESGRLMSYLTGPIYLNNILLGTVVIESYVDSITALVKDYSGLGETGETLFAKKDEDGNALFLTPLRFDPDAALKRVIHKSRPDTPIMRALNKEKDVFTDILDYRGQPVLAAIEYIKDTEWGLVVKIDTKEAFAPINKIRDMAFVVAMVALVSIILVALIIARTISNPIQALEKGIEIIGSGNLDYKVGTNARDEIGRLSRVFDEMTEKLKETTVSRNALTSEVAERKRTEKELQTANEELKKIDQLKSEFVSTVSHELRTPLSITKEGISLVLDRVPGSINEKQARILYTAKSNIDRLARIINNLLDISKIEAGQVELKKEKVDLGELIKQTALSFEPKVKEKKLELKINIPKSDISIYADSDRITQVLTNLIGNALKFTEKGKIEISAAQKGNGVECIISDTGIGIPRSNLDRIFEKFRQFGRTSGGGEKGTGLGLFIAKSIILMHKGRIWIESKRGEGSKFIFTVPKYNISKRANSRASSKK